MIRLKYWFVTNIGHNKIYKKKSLQSLRNVSDKIYCTSIWKRYVGGGKSGFIICKRTVQAQFGITEEKQIQSYRRLSNNMYIRTRTKYVTKSDSSVAISVIVCCVHCTIWNYRGETNTVQFSNYIERNKVHDKKIHRLLGMKKIFKCI